MKKKIKISLENNESLEEFVEYVAYCLTHQHHIDNYQRETKCKTTHSVEDVKAMHENLTNDDFEFLQSFSNWCQTKYDGPQ